MGNKQIRFVMRWLHILISIPLLLMVYTPLRNDPNIIFGVRFVGVPIVVITGLVLWQQPRLNKLRRRWSRKAVAK